LISVPWEARKNGSQNSAMLLEHFESEWFVPLRQRGVADHVRKHDGGKPALFS
jgi:hypothetical protein